MIPQAEYQWYPDTNIRVSTIPRTKYQWYLDTSIQVSTIPRTEYQWYRDTSIQVSTIPRTEYQSFTEQATTDKSFHPEFFSQTIKRGQIVSPSTFDKSMKHGQIVSPSTFIAKPSNTDKSFHPELLKTKNPYFNKCPKTIVLAFKKHRFKTLVKNTIFRATDPKTLKEMTPYRIKNWICPAICILTVWSKKWTKTFLTKWRKHYTNPATLKIHQPQHPQDGNPTELTTRNH